MAASIYNSTYRVNVPSACRVGATWGVVLFGERRRATPARRGPFIPFRGYEVSDPINFQIAISSNWRSIIIVGV
jgi:hypothetical protein